MERQRRDLAIQMGRRIREYEIPAYLVHTDSERTLREVFNRANWHGKQLKVDEAFDALHGMRAQGSPASLSQIVDELQTLDFGTLERKIVYRLLRVLQGADITQRAGAGQRKVRLQDAMAGRAARLAGH